MRIALTGQLRSGKDTIADFLVREYGFKKMAFGDAMKDSFHYTFPHISYDKKPRAYYQRYAQLLREIDEGIWIKRLEQKLADDMSERIVITDLRQPNEHLWCLNNEFYIVRVEAPVQFRLERAEDMGDDFVYTDLAHETEAHTASFYSDWVIENDCEVEFAYEQTREMVNAIVETNIDLTKLFDRKHASRLLAQHRNRKETKRRSID